MSWSDFILTGTLALFLLALGVVLFFVAYQRRLLSQQKEHQAKEAEYQQQLLRANLMSQERERNRIGKDLHDEVGAMLTTSKLYFRHLSQDSEPNNFNQVKQKALSLLDETMVSVRSVSHDLRPVVLERLGLVEAIANMADQINEAGGAHLEFKSPHNLSLDKEFELNWFRIVQELINNTLKHAQASEITIEILGQDQMLKLIYRDNGLGFDSKKTIEKGLGMQNIETRLKLMEGEMIVLKQEQGIKLELISRSFPTSKKL